MTHSEKIARLYQHLPALGISPSTAAPPLFRILWRMGIEIPPPLFLGFSSLALLMGGFFAIGFGLLLWLLTPLDPTPSPDAIPATALLAGLMFGLAMAAYYRYITRRASLAPWPEYKGRVGA